MVCLCTSTRTMPAGRPAVFRISGRGVAPLTRARTSADGGPPLGGRRRMSRTTVTKTATAPMATTPSSRKLLGAGSGCGVVVGCAVVGGAVVGGAVVGGAVVGAMAKPTPVTVTDVPGCPCEGANVITGLPTVSFTVIAGS